MYGLNSVIAAWFSFSTFFSISQPNYWEYFMAKTMESKVLPNIPGV